MKQYVVAAIRILVIALAGLAGAVVVGLMLYGSEVFVLTSPGFAFVSFGFSCALIFAFYHVRGLSEAITAAVVASAVQFFVATSYVPRLQAVIFSFGLNLPVIVVAYLFERRLAQLRAFRFVVVSLTYGAMFVLLTLLIGSLSGSSEIPAEAFRKNFVDGLLLGLGLGIGVEAGEALLHPLEIRTAGGRKA
ncbi:MAG: hypothetical protein H6Q06_2783 [Acidobacteria bacterium]|nr:hypothetical protein [Acidobacteriota bacterium]